MMLDNSVYFLCSTVPIFIQVHEKWRKLFYGQMEFAGFRTNFEMIHFRNVPHQYSYLSGLLDVFKSKLVRNISRKHTNLFRFLVN